jgi:hypothetical protein
MERAALEQLEIWRPQQFYSGKKTDLQNMYSQNKTFEKKHKNNIDIFDKNNSNINNDKKLPLLMLLSQKLLMK